MQGSWWEQESKERRTQVIRQLYDALAAAVPEPHTRVAIWGSAACFEQSALRESIDRHQYLKKMQRKICALGQLNKAVLVNPCKSDQYAKPAQATSADVIDLITDTVVADADLGFLEDLDLEAGDCMQDTRIQTNEPTGDEAVYRKQEEVGKGKCRDHHDQQDQQKRDKVAGKEGTKAKVELRVQRKKEHKKKRKPVHGNQHYSQGDSHSSNSGSSCNSSNSSRSSKRSRNRGSRSSNSRSSSNSRCSSNSSNSSNSRSSHQVASVSTSISTSVSTTSVTPTTPSATSTATSTATAPPPSHRHTHNDSSNRSRRSGRIRRHCRLCMRVNTIRWHAVSEMDMVCYGEQQHMQVTIARRMNTGTKENANMKASGSTQPVCDQCATQMEARHKRRQEHEEKEKEKAKAKDKGRKRQRRERSPTSKDLHKARQQGSLLELPRVKVRRTSQGNIEFLRF